ncbi:MAG TPA: hypothetical protein PK482_10670 [Spirochaetota bacterium]|jgi:hypothetical protein|nr:hypothetical protein [Spirochaetota bacterium]
MKLTANVNIKIKKGHLPHIIATLYKNGMEVSSANLADSDNLWDSYIITAVYSSRKEFNRLVNGLKKVDIVKEIYVSNSLEDIVKGGLILTASKLPIDNRNDIETLIYGATALAHERIESGLALDYLSLSKTLALVSVFKNMKKMTTEHYMVYLESERDGAIISKFLSMNSYPFTLKYLMPEDVIKTIKSMEDSFSIFRFINSGDEGFELYRNILSNISKPVIFKDIDEDPIFLLSVIKAAMKRNDFKAEETTLGFLGINKSAVRATEVLHSFYSMKILGYDNKENIMMTFENSGGLATTIQNVISSCDICIITDESLMDDVEHFLTPGSLLILCSDGIDRASLQQKGIRDMISINKSEQYMVMILSIRFLLGAGCLNFEANTVDKLSSLLSEYLSEAYSLPSFFAQEYGDLLKKLEGGLAS